MERQSPKESQPVWENSSLDCLLKLFISGYERCHTTDDTTRMSETLFSNVHNTHFMIPEDQKSTTTQ